MGNTLAKIRINPAKWGSPPRIWGIRVLLPSWLREAGITPTYMGNTRTRIKLFLAYEDHPHVYGEYQVPGLF